MSLVGCGSLLGEETLDPASELVVAYDGVPGVVDLQVESGLDPEGDEYVETVVTLEPEVTPQQVSDLVVGHPERVNGAGLPAAPEFRTLRLTFAEPDSPALGIDWKGGTSAATITPGVEHWFAVSDLLDVGVQMVLGTDGSELYAVPAGEDTGGAVGAAFATLRTDPEAASPTAVWDVTGRDESAALRMTVNGLPDEQQLEAWQGLVDALDTLPDDHEATGLEVSLSDRATVQVDLAAPVGSTADDLAFPDHREDIWPALKDQLDIVPQLADGWGYFVDVSPGDSSTTPIRLVTLLSSAEPADTGDLTSEWSTRARAHVDDRGRDDRARGDRGRDAGGNKRADG